MQKFGDAKIFHFTVNMGLQTNTFHYNQVNMELQTNTYLLTLIILKLYSDQRCQHQDL